MSSTTLSADRADPPPTAAPGASATVPVRHRAALFAAGALLTLFAAGGRWDITLAAWLAVPLLLRFSRTTRPAAGLPLVWLVSVGAALWWFWQLRVPLAPLPLIGAIGLGTVLAVPYVADRLLAPRLGTAARLLVFPAALTATEFVLGSYAPFGTAFGLLAVTQRDQTALLQVLSVAGPYSIAFLIGGFATTVGELWERPRLRPAAGYAAVLGVVLVFGGARLALVPAASTPTVRIAGINPARPGPALPDTGIVALSGLDPQAVRDAYGPVNDRLLADTRDAARAGSRIVFWSENAAHVPAGDEQAFIARAADVARAEQIYLDIAVQVVLPAKPYGRDETVLLGPDGQVLWTYQKAHPIPGLEPYRPGDGRVPVVSTPYGRIANVICYDADFPAIMHVDADIMLVPGGDWPEMGRVHTQMAGLRAVENGYALVRQDYDGSSQAFDHQGHVLSQQDTTNPAQTAPWIVDVPVKGVTTVYRIIGDAFAWLCVALVAAAVVLRVQRRAVRKATAPATP
ncbi:nitrilase-related carbon-nitrogen hydrolase [Dactylosporangium sp. CA-092794]|uniref:nitrilase-related carbon-nitrogen hydrolase n=1 Tax=Dactylosporangium sp. CA-092794 TaxID=3239929 RepID=UPI003D8C003F